MRLIKVPVEIEDGMEKEEIIEGFKEISRRYGKKIDMEEVREILLERYRRE